MAETHEQYTARLASYVEGRDPIAMQGEAPFTVAQLLRNVRLARLKEPPAPGKWSIIQIVMHLAEDELTSTAIARRRAIPRPVLEFLCS